MNMKWVEIANEGLRDNSILVKISFKDEIDKNDIYISPIVFSLLSFPSFYHENKIVLKVFNSSL